MKNLVLSFFLLTAGIAIADDNAPVGIRPMSNEVLNELNAAKENEETTHSDESIAPAATTEETAGCYPSDSFIYVPNSCHWVVALSAIGDSVSIEDGSIWQANPFNSYAVLSWYLNDIVTITQNQSWFSSYQYLLVNKNNGTSVAVNLSLGPIIFCEHSLQIIDIDPFNGILVLSDQSHWKISSLDYYLFSEWALRDYIILGVNSGWDSSSPYLLINSNMNNHIRAKQY